jgi:predicted peptidase
MAHVDEGDPFMTSQQTAFYPAPSNRRFGWLEACLLLSVTTLFAQLLPDVLRVYREWPRPGPQTPYSAELTDAQGDQWSVQYFVYFPEGYCAERPVPLLLYLHGSGQRGDDLNQVLRWGLPQLIGSGLTMPMMVVSPQCRAKVTWDSRQLLVFLDHLQQRYAIDPDRIYVSGESMGGYGTWELIGAAPERFAAAVPVCGGGHVEQEDRMAKLPIWAFHGAKDNVVPIEQSQRMVDAVRAAGGDARLTVFPGAGHGISELVFARQDLYAWLLEHPRQH